MGVRSERWLIKPLSCPRVVRYCSSCGAARHYECNERFRINAQKKTIDVWLKYGCIECGDTWKYPLLERCAIAAISDELYAAFVNHETVTVWRYAFDIARLRRYVSEVQADVDISVERRVDSVDGPDVLITFDVPFVCGTRLDRLLSKELGVSRATVQNWFEVGAAQSPCGERVAMNKPVCDRQQLLLRAESCGERARPLASARSSKG